MPSITKEGFHKIHEEHFARAAYVYVRQSSPYQVEHHLGSKIRQYDLAKWAGELGWSSAKIITVDEDQGESGSLPHARSAFGQMVKAVARGEVGIVIGLEASRLARNNRVPRLALKFLTRGRGLIKGKWVFDDKDLGLFNFMILSSNVTKFKRTDLPRLSSRDLGMHTFTFEFLNYLFKKQVPILKYFVSEKGAIRILSPRYNSKIRLRETVKLEWKTDEAERLYEVAVTRIPFQYLKDNQIKWLDTGGKNYYELDLSDFKKKDWVYWLVREKNESGRILTTSEVSMFKLVDIN